MKIIYLTNVRLPTERAHGYQIMKMCEAFAATAEVELIVPRRINHLKEDTFTFYGIKRAFKIIRLPCLDLISLGMGRFGYWVEMLTFMLSAKAYLLFRKHDILYTREFPVANIFKDVILEIHDIPGKVASFHRSAWKKAR